MPAIPLRIKLPDVVRITSLEGHATHIEVKLRVDEWRFDHSDVMAMVKRSP